MNFIPGLLGLGTVLVLEMTRHAFGEDIQAMSGAFIFLGCLVAFWRAG